MENYGLNREEMVKTQLIPRGIHDPLVLDAMRKVPRDPFVPEKLKKHAYEDGPLPIGQDQTISQPYIVALMTEALGLNGENKTLEVGTGSGYQTAILAELSRAVYTVERIESLQNKAKSILEQLGYKNIYFKVVNGTLGWDEHAPYNAIIVTAGAPKIPNPLIEQLEEGGRLLIPVGDRFGQELIRITRQGGHISKESLGGVRFVNLIGEYGWQE